jgi:hypothetical protein
MSTSENSLSSSPSSENGNTRKKQRQLGKEHRPKGLGSHTRKNLQLKAPRRLTGRAAGAAASQPDRIGSSRPKEPRKPLTEGEKGGYEGPGFSDARTRPLKATPAVVVRVTPGRGPR